MEEGAARAPPQAGGGALAFYHSDNWLADTPERTRHAVATHARRPYVARRGHKETMPE
jgi:hypothetical protein